MFELILEELDLQFPRQNFLSLQDICRYMGVSESVVYNWNKRRDAKRRPPCLTVGRELRFQKRLFAKFLEAEQQDHRG
jgi:hypothetical protein